MCPQNTKNSVIYDVHFHANMTTVTLASCLNQWINVTNSITMNGVDYGINKQCTGVLDHVTVSKCTFQKLNTDSQLIRRPLPVFQCFTVRHWEKLGVAVGTRLCVCVCVCVCVMVCVTVSVTGLHTAKGVYLDGYIDWLYAKIRRFFPKGHLWTSTICVLCSCTCA